MVRRRKVCVYQVVNRNNRKSLAKLREAVETVASWRQPGLRKAVFVAINSFLLDVFPLYHYYLQTGTLKYLIEVW